MYQGLRTIGASLPLISIWGTRTYDSSLTSSFSLSNSSRASDSSHSHTQWSRTTSVAATSRAASTTFSAAPSISRSRLFSALSSLRFITTRRQCLTSSSGGSFSYWISITPSPSACRTLREPVTVPRRVLRTRIFVQPPPPSRRHPAPPAAA